MGRYAVIGLGRFGAMLATTLAQRGAEVIAIDKNRSLVERIRDQVSLSVRLDSTDEEALKAQGVDKVDVAISGIGQANFESAILTVVNLRQLGLEQIYARAETLMSGRVFEKVGATEVIYPEREAAERWAYKVIAPQISEKIDFAPGYSLARIKAPASFEGKSVEALQLRQEYDVNLALVKPVQMEEQDEAPQPFAPRAKTVIHEGDVLMVIGSDEDLARLPQE
jgi:trk system potassium uptake protein TrkA